MVAQSSSALFLSRWSDWYDSTTICDADNLPEHTLFVDEMGDALATDTVLHGGTSVHVINKFNFRRLEVLKKNENS
jgi:hypothetical protein